MRIIISLLLMLAGAYVAAAEELPFAKAVKASLMFRDDFDAARHYPHILKVFLCLENVHDSDVSWVANARMGIEAELLDASGNPVPQGPAAASIQSNANAYLLPFGSRLDWLVSHGGVSLLADAKDKYALIVGSRGWLIPVETAGSYSLRIRLRGTPWRRSAEKERFLRSDLLLDLPPAKLEVTK